MASLASASSNEKPSSDSSETQQETFENFFECWIHEQDSYLRQLISVSKSHKSEPGEDDDERVFKPLLNRVIQHYEAYYRIKSVWVKKHALSMLTPCWRSYLEGSFIWIGGWRPSMAFHLLYSKSGLQLKARLVDIMCLCRLPTCDLSDLSESQLVLVDELQRTTIREEKELTEKFAGHQETVADSLMVELSETATELTMSQNENDEMANETQNSGGEESEGDVGKRVETALKSKEVGLEKIMERANDLRLKTFKRVIEILSPIQAVHFLIAAAALHIRVHDWGKDNNHQHQHGIPQNHYGGSSTGTVPAVAVAAAAAGGGGGGGGGGASTGTSSTF